jgi:hypothetical protein
MLETIITGLVIAAFSGLAFLAYNHPKGFRSMTGVLALGLFVINTLVGIFFTGYVIGFHMGQSSNSSHALPSWWNGFFLISIIVIIFLLFLTYLPLITKADGKDDADDDKPPKRKKP